MRTYNPKDVHIAIDGKALEGCASGEFVSVAHPVARKTESIEFSVELHNPFAFGEIDGERPTRTAPIVLSFAPDMRVGSLVFIAIPMPLYEVVGVSHRRDDGAPITTFDLNPWLPHERETEVVED